MATIQVTISNQTGARIPSVSRIPIGDGVEIAFSAAEDAPTALCFTEPLAALLSPQPPSPTVQLGAGETRTFSIGSAQPGSYCVVLQSPEFPRPNNIGCNAWDPATVLLITGDGSDYPVGPEDPQQLDSSGALR